MCASQNAFTAPLNKTIKRMQKATAWIYFSKYVFFLVKLY